MSPLTYFTTVLPALPGVLSKTIQPLGWLQASVRVSPFCGTCRL